MFLLFGFNAIAQNFEWEVELEKPSETKFYDIQLSPQIVGKFNPNFSDIRIFDETNTEVPYLLRREKMLEMNTFYNEYTIVEKKHQKKFAHTELIFENPSKKDIDNIVLRIRNSDVSKWLTLNGSDNRNEWFVIKNEYRYSSFYSDSETSVIKVLNFPLSNYKYYQLIVSDFVNQPIDIVSVGYYDTQTANGLYTKAMNAQMVQKDSSEIQKSIIYVRFPENQYIDKLVIIAKGASYFLRKAEIVENKTVKKKKKTVMYQEVLSSFELSSFSDNTIVFDKQPLKEFIIYIYNNDDSPLEIEAVEAYMLNTYLTAELKTGKQYKLRFGNPQLRAPVYDLQYFADSLPKKRVSILPQSLKNIGNQKVDNTQGNIPQVVIWLVLGAVLVFLGFMTYRMMNDMKKKQ